MKSMTRWCSVDEIAEHLGVTRDTIYRWINQKDLPAHRIGRLWKFQLSEVDEWVRSGGASEKKPPSSLFETKKTEENS